MAGETTRSDPFQAAMQELYSLLNQSDMRAIESFARLKSRYAAALGAVLGPLDLAMAQLDFPAAAALCKTLNQHLEKT